MDKGKVIATLQSLLTRYDVSYDAKKIIVNLIVDLDSTYSWESLLKLAKASM